MGHKLSQRTSTPPDWNRALIMAWLAGALVLQVPFQRTLKLGAGNLGYNILIGAAAITAGVMVLVSLAHLYRRLLENRPGEHRAYRLTLGVLVSANLILILTLSPAIPFSFYWAALVILGIWLGVLFIYAFESLRNLDRTRLRHIFRPAIRHKAWPFNGAFWILVLLLLLIRDFTSFAEIQNRNTWESLLLILGRIVSLGGFTVAAILISHSLLAFFPPYTRWLVIAGAVLIPLLVLADSASDLYWQQPLVDLVNNLTLDGKFDLRVELEAAGIKQSPLQVTLVVLIIIGLAIGAYLGLQKLSRKFNLRLRTSRAILVLAGLWMGSIGQQALSMVSVRKEVWQAEHAAFSIHLGLLRPNPGLETLSVRFVLTQSRREEEQLLSGALPSLQKKPDIYVVMVETWRSDTVRPAIMPFLSRFAKEECQQFGTTFAGSNCTPVSWYTFFHSKIGIDWRNALGEAREPGGFKGSYPIRLLHKLGYRFSVRAVCDLSYKQMCDLNFGHDHKFAERFLDAPLIPGKLGIPEREMVIFDDLKMQLENTPKGGHLHFISLDSAHYNYYWPSQDFTPIHQDCAAIDFGALKPTPDQIREVVKRYENAVNWIDRQMEEFIAYLKEQGRYDNSIIILTGDHGEEFQENGAWFHCSSLRREQIEVPIMIRWPEWVQNQPRQDLVSHMDVMPSILEALGLDPKYFKGLAGSSVLGEHPGEALLSTRWPGKSGIGVCLVADKKKANFKATRLWLEGIPETLYFMGWTDFADQPLDPLQIRGSDRCHDALRDQYPDSIGRHFDQFPGTK
ncbi:MAG: sulfatase-like hydrolase/transferase [Roseibacillus sp.]|nr:sulfatase-like hydrolase/transferase [Roseibacillus sp.]